MAANLEKVGEIGDYESCSFASCPLGYYLATKSLLLLAFNMRKYGNAVDDNKNATKLPKKFGLLNKESYFAALQQIWTSHELRHRKFETHLSNQITSPCAKRRGTGLTKY